MLTISGDSGYPCLVPDFRGNAFNFSPLRMFGVGLSYMAFIMLRYVPSIPPFWRIFFHYKWMLNFVKGFHCIYWNNHMVFIFQFVNVVYHIDWFANIEEYLHHWDESHLVMMCVLFNIFFIVICLKIFLNFLFDFFIGFLVAMLFNLHMFLFSHISSCNFL